MSKKFKGLVDSFIQREADLNRLILEDLEKEVLELTVHRFFTTFFNLVSFDRRISGSEKFIKLQSTTPVQEDQLERIERLRVDFADFLRVKLIPVLNTEFPILVDEVTTMGFVSQAFNLEKQKLLPLKQVVSMRNFAQRLQYIQQWKETSDLYEARKLELIQG